MGAWIECKTFDIAQPRSERRHRAIVGYEFYGRVGSWSFGDIISRANGKIMRFTRIKHDVARIVPAVGSQVRRGRDALEIREGDAFAIKITLREKALPGHRIANIEPYAEGTIIWLLFR